MAGQHYCLRWNNYQSNMTSVFHHLLRTEAFVDVTLACNEESLKAHKVVLSACSSYFQKLLLENPCKHPTIIMPQDVCFSDLKFIIEFVYRGEIDVSQAELQSLLKTADQLKIKGLCEVPEGSDGKEMVSAEVTPLPPRSISTTAPRRFSKLRRLNAGSKRRFEVKRQLYRDRQLQQQQQQQQHHQQHQQQQLVNHSNQSHLPPHHPVPPPPLQPLQVPNNQHQMHQHPHQHQPSPQPSQPQNLQEHSPQQHSPQQPPHLMQPVVSSTIHNDSRPNEVCEQMQSSVSGCITVGTSTEDDQKGGDMPVVILESRVGHGHSSPPQQLTLHTHPHSHPHQHTTETRIMMTSPAPIMSTHSMPTTQQVVLETTRPPTDVEMSDAQQPTGPTATLVSSIELQTSSPSSDHLQEASEMRGDDVKDVKVKFETLRAMEQAETLDIDSHMSERVADEEHTMHTMMITPELLGLIPSSSHSEVNGSLSDGTQKGSGINKSWTQEDMDMALDALRNHNMSLTKASITYGIPSTTLWQRAHRLGIDTPKKDGPSKSWTEDILNVALEALRNGSISANKASKAYGIPSSTLYKIARREGIRLAAPFNAAPTTWNPDDLERALEAIRSGQTTVQKASAEYGIPSGTLYGRCKREGIELSRSNPTPWSEDAMNEALESVRIGQMSINQAAIHYNLPYSSLYGRFKRGKYEAEHNDVASTTSDVEVVSSMGGVSATQHNHVATATVPPPHIPPQIMLVQYQQAPPQLQMYQHAPS